MNAPKLDRTFHWAGKHVEHEERIEEYLAENTVIQRLEAAYHLNSIVYGSDINNPARKDRAVFSTKIRK